MTWQHKEKWIARGFNAVLGLILTVSTLFIWNTYHLVHSYLLVSHTHDVIENLNASFAALRDAESSVRGYVLTGDEAYLDAYKTTPPIALDKVDYVSHLTKDNPQQQNHISELIVLIHSRLKVMDEAVSSRKLHGLTKIQPNIVSHRGRDVMLQIQGLITKMIRDENTLLEIRQKASARHTYYAIGLVVISTFLSIGLLLWIYDVIRKQIAERITAEMKSKGIQTFMEMVFDNIPNMIFVKEAKNLHFTIFNKAGEELLGCSREELLGKNDFDLFPREQAEFFVEKDRQVLREGKMLDIPEETIKTPIKGNRILHTKKIPLLDKNGEPRYLLGISEDITDHKQFENATRKSEEIFAVGQLATRMAHQLTIPLDIILESAASAFKYVSQKEGIEFPIKAIEREVDRCKTLVQELLTFCWQAKPELKPMDLNEAVKSAFSMLRSEAQKKSLDVRLELASDLPWISADRRQIEQIVINLVTQSIETVGNRGILTLKSERFDHGAKSWVYFKVCDTRNEMPKETMAHLFDPLFTSQSGDFRNGLGLTLVHELVRKHGGFMDVQSQAGYTEFCVKFPAAVVEQKKAA